MKIYLKAALLFGALFLTGCGATTTTEATTAWVDDWTKQMKTAADSIGARGASSMCDGGGVTALLHLFIKKSEESLTKYMSLEDMIHLSRAQGFTLAVIAQVDSCLKNESASISHAIKRIQK